MLYGVRMRARRRGALAGMADLFLCSAGAVTVATDRQHQRQLLCHSVTFQAALNIIAMEANPIMPNAPPPPSVRAALAQRAHITAPNTDTRLPG